MAVQGLIGTGEFETDERPKNWREGILMRFPNGHAPLTALTAVMKKKVTDDPEFNWWEREVSNVRLELDGSLGAGAGPDAITLVADPFGFTGGDQVKVGDLLYVEESGEILKVTVYTSNTAITVTRSHGDVASTAVTLGAGVNPHMFIMGSVHAEGDSTPESIRYRAEKFSNYTQIFRNSLKATRTAMQTRLRTVEEVRDAKQQTLLYHSIAMEYALIFGDKKEDLSAQPERSTDGIINRIPTANIEDFGGTATSLETFEAEMLEAFRFGSQEKMCFCGNRFIQTVQGMVRRSNGVSIEITPATKEFGMDVRRLFTPFGTLVMKTHPLFNQITSDLTGTPYYSLDTWGLIVDMANITYRPLRNSDTQYLPDRQANGVDGLTSEYLTEAGIETHHGKTHYLLKGLNAAV